MGFAICLTAAFTYIGDLIPETRLNEGLGIFGVSGIIGTAVGPAVAELVIDEFGFQMLFIASGMMATLALVIHLPLAETFVHDLRKTPISFFTCSESQKNIAHCPTSGPLRLRFGGIQWIRLPFCQ